ncbi:MAG: hypothetical protein KDD52_04395 [Bdellovibrionales bacterium]|nr:hypothetical protein [Bdellovibrionales bacterium]
MNLSAKILFISSCVYFSFAHAQEIPLDLLHAQSSVRQRNFALVTAQVQTMIDQMKLNTLDSIALAHKLLGVSYCELNQMEKSNEHFSTWVLFDDQASLENFETSLRCKQTLAKYSKKQAQLLTPKSPDQDNIPKLTLAPKEIQSPQTLKTRPRTFSSSKEELISIDHFFDENKRTTLRPFGIMHHHMNHTTQATAYMFGELSLYSSSLPLILSSIYGKSPRDRWIGIGLLSSASILTLIDILHAKRKDNSS